MKKNSVLIALFVAALVFVFPLGAYAVDEPSTDGLHQHQDVSSESTDGVKKDQPELQKTYQGVIYAGVPCVYSVKLDEIQCGLFPLKQAIGLLRDGYVEPLDTKKLAEIAIAAGTKHIKKFAYGENRIKALDVVMRDLEGVQEKYNPDDWQWWRMTYLLRPLSGALVEARPSVEKLGPRAFELLVKEARDAAISAIIDTLDPHTDYVAVGSEKHERVIEAANSISGNEKFGGIGAALREWELEVGPVYIRMPFPNTPAGGKLEPFDEILKVDGVPVTGAKDAVSKIRGTIGTTLTLSIRRDGIVLPDIVLERKEIKPQSAVGKLYVVGDTRVCYVFTSQFAVGIGAEIRSLFAEDGVCALADTAVFDYRGNGGGNLREAIEVMQASLPKTDADVSHEVLLRIVGRSSEIITRDAAKAMQRWKYPPVLLQDNESASASEIVLGALDPYVIRIGDRPFGKSAVMMRFMLSDGSVFTMTINKFLLRDFGDHDGKGFMPHIYFNKTLFKRFVPKTPPEREENKGRYRGTSPHFSDTEKLLIFLGNRDPELGIALSLFVHPEKFFHSIVSEKGGNK